MIYVTGDRIRSCPSLKTGLSPLCSAWAAPRLSCVVYSTGGRAVSQHASIWLNTTKTLTCSTNHCNPCLANTIRLSSGTTQMFWMAAQWTEYGMLTEYIWPAMERSSCSAPFVELFGTLPSNCSGSYMSIMLADLSGLLSCAQQPLWIFICPTRPLSWMFFTSMRTSFKLLWSFLFSKFFNVYNIDCARRLLWSLIFPHDRCRECFWYRSVFSLRICVQCIIDIVISPSHQ